MDLPLSTYRLQFRNGMDFAGARRLVPYLEDLGITHLYASPVITAASGSTHGYDIADMNEIDPALGGEGGLRHLAADLHARGLGLILDIVPNHMAAHLENPWWRSVVTFGPESPFARYFDIDWSERLTLPFLGGDFDAELAAGTMGLALDPKDGRPALRYHDTFYPIHPRTYPLFSPGEDPALLRAIHDAQPWRLADWKTAGRHLSYRRFFEIAGLVGLRVEEPAVFADSHRLILSLVRDGTVDGLRIDHIDGLADPAAYLEQLRAAVGPQTYIVVEKILEKEEPLPADWPVEGPTGYEFIASLADALVDPAGQRRLQEAFTALKPPELQRPYATERQAGKRQMLQENFHGETAAVAGLAARIAEDGGQGFDRETLRAAVEAFVIALPVYRTYATAAAVGEADRALVERVRRRARQAVEDEDIGRAVDFIADLMAGTPAPSVSTATGDFRRRLQQLSGPIMAKAVEDTLFYRENALIALNEVGGDPGTPAGGLPAFHAAMERRAASMPAALSATSTHDTKRGEDARARLYALSEAPDDWVAATRRWRALDPRRALSEPTVEWLVYQALAGIWPVGGYDAAMLQALRERMALYVPKALREAKLASHWSAPDLAYEETVAGFVDRLLADEAFLGDFNRTLAPFVAAGLVNSIGQTLIKLTAPGIPDIYQGSELSDFSLVDPDNRAALDPAALALGARPQATAPGFARYKQWLTAEVLKARKEAPGCFLKAPYIALDAGNALAFLRGTPDAFAITLVPRLVFGKTAPDSLLLRKDALEGVRVAIPAGFSGRRVHSLLDGRAFTLGADLPLGDVLAEAPVALLLSARNNPGAPALLPL